MDTKSRSYKKTSVAEREYELLHLLGKHGKMSRRQLAQELGVESNSVTAAARNLLNQGKVIELGEVYDQETKRHQKMLTINHGEVNIKDAPINKTWRISSLELEVKQLQKRITLLVALLRYMSARDAAVSQLIKEFHELQVKVQENEPK